MDEFEVADTCFTVKKILTWTIILDNPLSTVYHPVSVQWRGASSFFF